VKLTTHLQLVPKSRKCRSIHSLPHMSSRRNALLVKNKNKCTFYSTYLFIFIYSYCIQGSAYPLLVSCVVSIENNSDSNLILLQYDEKIGALNSTVVCRSSICRRKFSFFFSSLTLPVVLNIILFRYSRLYENSCEYLRVNICFHSL
jgi:hypothetical protein